MLNNLLIYHLKDRYIFHSFNYFQSDLKLILKHDSIWKFEDEIKELIQESYKLIYRFIIPVQINSELNPDSKPCEILNERILCCQQLFT